MATNPADINARYEAWKRRQVAGAELPARGGATLDDRYAAWKARKQVFEARQAQSQTDLTGRETQGAGQSFGEAVSGPVGGWGSVRQFLFGGPEAPAPVPPVAQRQTPPAAGLQPDETGHWPSRVPSGPNEGLILKDEAHPTFGETIKGEAQAGYEFYRDKMGRLRSFPVGSDPGPDYVREKVGPDQVIAARVQAQAQQRAAAGQPFYPAVVPVAQAGERIPTERLANAPGLPPTTGQPIGQAVGRPFLGAARGLASAPLAVGQELLGAFGARSPEAIDDAAAKVLDSIARPLGLALRKKMIDMRLSGAVPPEMSVMEYLQRQIAGTTTAAPGSVAARAAYSETAGAKLGKNLGSLAAIPITFPTSMAGIGVQELLRQLNLHPEEEENIQGWRPYARTVLMPGRIGAGLWEALIGMIPAAGEFIGLRERLTAAPDDQTRNAIAEDWIATELGTAAGTAIGLTPMAIHQIKAANKWGRDQREILRQRKVLGDKLQTAVRKAGEEAAGQEPPPPPPPPGAPPGPQPSVPPPTAPPGRPGLDEEMYRKSYEDFLAQPDVRHPERQKPIIQEPGRRPVPPLTPDLAREAGAMTPVDLAPPVTPAVTAPRAVTSVSEIDAFPSGPVPPGLTIGGYEITGISRSAKSKPGDPVAFVDIRNPENGIEGVWSRKQIEEELGGPTQAADLAGRNVLEPAGRPIRPTETQHDLEAWKTEMLDMGFDNEIVNRAVDDALAQGVDPTLSDDLNSLSEFMDALEVDGKVKPWAPGEEAGPRAGRRKQAAFQPVEATTPPEVTTPPAEVRPTQGEAPEAKVARKLRWSVDKAVDEGAVTRAEVHPDTYARTGAPEDVIVFDEETGHYKEDSATHFAESGERQAWRNETIDTHLATVPPATPENRVLVYTGGGPGSGKTKTFQTIFADAYRRLLGISSDDNKLKHPEYQREMAKKDRGEPYQKKIALYVHEEASSMAKAELHTAVNQGIPVVYDSTGKNLALIEQANETARNHGYQTSYVYVDATPAFAMRLANERNARSGRATEANNEAEMARDHEGPAKAVLKILGEAPRVDEVLVYTNDTYGGQAHLIAHRTGAGEPVVLDREAFTNLEKKAKITLEEVQRAAKPKGPNEGRQAPRPPQPTGGGGVPPVPPGRPGPSVPGEQSPDRGRAPAAARPTGPEGKAPEEVAPAVTPPETPPTPPEPTVHAKQPLSVRNLMASLREEVKAGREIPNTPVALGKWIEERFEGYDVDTVYDALEGVAASEFMERRHMEPVATRTLARDLELAQEIEDKIGTFKRPRGPEDYKEQKFSTPLPIAVLGAHMAGVREGELVMEPTAGTGNLVAALTVRPGFDLMMGEVNPVRADVLRQVFPNDPVTHGDYFLLPRTSGGVLKDAEGNEVRPQVIYTNPPWINIKGGKAAQSDYWRPAAVAGLPFRPTDASERFLFHNLTELADGGRLVAVLPTRIKQSGDFLDWLEDNHTVRALVTMPEGSYDTRATRVGSTLLVVDKGKIPDAPPRIQRQLANMNDAADIVEALGPDGTHARPKTEVSGAKPRTPPMAPVERPVAPVAPATGAPGERTEPAPGDIAPGAGGTTEPTGPRPGRPGRPGGGDELEPEGGGVDTGLVLGGGARPTQPGEAAPTESIRARRVVSRTPEPEYRKRFTAVRASDYLAALRSRIFAPFTAVGKGRNTPHPRQLVESRMLASVPGPELVTELHPDLYRFNKEGTFSDESYDSVARLHQATNNGHAMLIADGTGIGKSRQIGAAAYEWHKSGTRRTLVVTAKETNITDLHDEFRMLVGKVDDLGKMKEDVPDFPAEFITLRDYKIPKGQKDLPDFPIRDGIYFIEYGNLAKYLPLIKRVFSLPGKELALIGDEAHLMRNLKSAQGAAWTELHQHLMGTNDVRRIGYFTASPGVQLEELTYLYGMRLWKPTVKSFNNWLLRVSGRAKKADAQTFLADQKVRLQEQLDKMPVWAREERDNLRSKMAAVDQQLAASVGLDGGEAASERGEEFQIRTNPFDPTFSSAELEQIMRELKITGRYMSRELWHGGTKVEGTKLDVPKADWDEYEQVRDFARRLDMTFRDFGRFNKLDKGAKRWGIRGALQAELKRRLAYYRLKNALPLIKEAIHNGENIVISLINVNASKEEGGDLGKALGAINTKDVQVDDDGVVTSSTDMPELERHVLLLREEMMDLPKIPDPIKFLEDELGRDNVISLTGRTPPGQRKGLRLRFQENKGRVLVISDASKVGISAHHKVLDNLERPPKGWKPKNDTGLYLDDEGKPLPAEKIQWAQGQRRMFYMDYDWSVIKTLQGVGRVDRTGQISSPIINFMLTGQAAERKVVATAASRLQATGAVSRGAGEASGIDPLSEFDMSGTLALTAMRRTWTKLPREIKDWFIGSKFKDQGARDPHAPAHEAPPSLTTTADMKDFLLEVMLLPREVGNKVLEEVIGEMDRVLEFGGDVTAENFKDLPEETKVALKEQAKEMGMDVGDILSLRASEASAKTERAAGEIIKEVDLGPETALAVVKDSSGKKYGVLYGTFTEEMNDVLTAIGYDHTGEIPTPPARHYVSFDAGEHNQITGLKIKPSALDRVAKVFGGQIASERVTPEGAVEALKLGDEIAVRAQDWSVKRRRDGKNEIHGLKFKDRLEPAFDKLLTSLGVKYDAQRRFHYVEDAKVADFLTEFGIKSRAAESEVVADLGLEVPEDARVGDVQHYNPRAANYQAPAPNSPQAAEVKGLNQVIDDLAEATNAVIRAGRFREPGKPLAIFKKTPEVLRFKPTTSLQGKFAAVTHEIGHLIEKRLFGKGLTRTRGVDHDTRVFKAKFGGELMQLAKTQTVPTLSEGLAEFVRRYIQDDAALRQDVPKLYAFLDRKLPDALQDMHEGLLAARRDYEAFTAGGPEARMWSAVSTEPKKANAKSFDKLWTHMTDDLHPIKAIVDDVTGKKKLADGDNPEVIHRVLRGWRGKAESFLKWGTLKFNGIDRIGKPLKEIFDPIWDQRKEFTLYMMALRDAEYRRPTPGHPKGLELPWEEADAQATLLKLDSPAFRKAAAEYRAYREALLDYIRDGGMLNDAQLKSLRELGENHIPFYRVAEGVDSGRTYALPERTGNIFHPIRGKKGGAGQIVDPLESAFKNTYLLINAAERNAAALSLVRFLKGTEGYGKYLEEVPVRIVPRKVNVEEVLDKAGLSHRLSEAQKEAVTIFRPDLYETEPNTITVWERGARKHYRVHPDLYNAMMGSDREPSNVWFRVLSKFAHVLRVGATTTLAFGVKNPLRDQFSAYVNRKYKSNIPGLDFLRFFSGANLVEGIYHAARQDQAYRDAAVAGAFYSEMVSMDRDYMGGGLRDLMKTRMQKMNPLTLLRHPIQHLQALSALGEQATRLMEVKRGLAVEGRSRRGATAAGYSGREVTLDFQRVGASVYSLNQINAFFNAGIQGLAKIGRQAKTDPVGFGARVTAAITVPSMLLYLANRNDPRYQAMDDAEKDLFWHILTPDHVYRIPKPFELGIFFGSFPERVLRYMEKQDPHAFDGWARTMLRAVPNPLAVTAVVPLAEAWANKSTYFNRKIVPTGMEKLDPEEQYQAYTPQVYREIGKATHTSPLMMEHLWGGYTGGLGRDVARGASWLGQKAHAFGQETLPQQSLMQFMGLESRFPGGSTAPVEQLYDALGKAERADATLRHYGATGHPEKVAPYLAEHPEATRLGGLKHATGYLSELRRERSQVLADKGLTRSEKEEKIRALDNRMLSFAQERQRDLLAPQPQ